MGTDRQMNGGHSPILQPAFIKHWGWCSDNKLMTRRFTAEWWTGVLVLAILGWHAAFPAVCFAADQPSVFASNHALAATWLTDLPMAQAQAKAEGKFVLINFTGSDWCGWCMKLRKEVFLKPEFNDYSRTNLILVEVDFPKRKPQPAPLQQANQKLAEQFEVQGYPTLIVLDSQGKKLGRVSYGSGGPKSFLAELAKVTRPPPDPIALKAPATKPADSRGSRKTTALAQTDGTDLTLYKITGTKRRRQALINNQTLSAGQTAIVRLSHGVVTLRCVEIRERSVIVTLNGTGEKRELKLAEGI
jgi:protein disulfide-isomerase